MLRAQASRFVLLHARGSRWPAGPGRPGCRPAFFAPAEAGAPAATPGADAAAASSSRNGARGRQLAAGLRLLEAALVVGRAAASAGLTRLGPSSGWPFRPAHADARRRAPAPAAAPRHPPRRRLRGADRRLRAGAPTARPPGPAHRQHGRRGLPGRGGLGPPSATSEALLGPGAVEAVHRRIPPSRRRASIVRPGRCAPAHDGRGTEFARPSRDRSGRPGGREGVAAMKQVELGPRRCVIGVGHRLLRPSMRAVGGAGGPTVRPAAARSPRRRQPQPGPPPGGPRAVYRVPAGRLAGAAGRPTRLVTIVESSDFECPFCKRVGPTLKQLEQAFPGKLRFAFKHNPLPLPPAARCRRPWPPRRRARRRATPASGPCTTPSSTRRRRSTRPPWSGPATAAGLDLARLRAALAEQDRRAAHPPRPGAGHRPWAPPGRRPSSSTGARSPAPSPSRASAPSWRRSSRRPRRWWPRGTPARRRLRRHRARRGPPRRSC
ncbi:MAG: hypothetical protein MZV70_54050 [Desulfobacterales bacterium]|nr:hypothetical protein [Desulfobacterales bacterium]